MKILVAVKRVIDYKSVIRIKPDESNVETANVKMSMNPFDEIAVEEAIRLKEKGIASEILIVSLGAETSLETIRAALAMGGDRGLLIKHNEELSPLQTAGYLYDIVNREGIDLVLAGKQAIDTDNGQMGQMLAALLQWPQATFASSIEFRDDGLEVVREVDGGLETVFISLPAVVTTDLRLNQPRYISLPNIVQAKKKALEIVESSTLATQFISKIKKIKVTAPAKRNKGIIVNSVAELLSQLKNDGQGMV